jgi:hypothetical protein
VNEFTAADALKINEPRLGFGNSAQRSGAIGHAPDLRRIIRRTDDAQFITCPRPHVDTVSVGDEVRGNVPGMHREQIHLSRAHGFIKDGTRASRNDFNVIAGFRFEHFGNLRPQTGHGHATDDGTADRSWLGGRFRPASAGGCKLQKNHGETDDAFVVHRPSCSVINNCGLEYR